MDGAAVSRLQRETCIDCVAGQHRVCSPISSRPAHLLRQRKVPNRIHPRTGAVRVNGTVESLEVTQQSRVVLNSVTGAGGFLWAGGDVTRLTLTGGSALSGNSAAGAGGGVCAVGALSQVVVAQTSVVSENSAGTGSEGGEAAGARTCVVRHDTLMAWAGRTWTHETQPCGPTLRHPPYPFPSTSRRLTAFNLHMPHPTSRPCRCTPPHRASAHAPTSTCSRPRAPRRRLLRAAGCGRHGRSRQQLSTPQPGRQRRVSGGGQAGSSST